MPSRERVTEIVECRNCGTKFDLAAQDYYYDLCPTCNREDLEDNE